MALDDTPSLDYHHFLWGDMIHGSKTELQALGIGAGMPFPGEPGGAKRSMRCRDPRGFPCTIAHLMRDGDRYECRIPFPGRHLRPAPLPPEPIAPGVLRRTDCPWFDEFVGTAEALAAAGLVAPDQFPGMPGMRKTIVTILPNGAVFDGPRTSNKPAGARAPGAKHVHKGPGLNYRVQVVLDKATQTARWQAHQARALEREAKLRAMPRPPPLVLILPERDAAARERRGQLRLVWSRPGPSFHLPA